MMFHWCKDHKLY